MFGTGAKVIFQSSPTSLIEDLSPSLTLTCQLDDTATSGSIVGRRDVSQTADNMASISSVIIMKDGSDVASVSSTQSAHVMDGSTNVLVSGSITGNPGKSRHVWNTSIGPKHKHF